MVRPGSGSVRDSDCDHGHGCWSESKTELRYHDENWAQLEKAEEAAARLQTQLHLAQREASKKEVRCKALQRDAGRLQAAQAAQSADANALRDELVAQAQRASEAALAAEQPPAAPNECGGTSAEGTSTHTCTDAHMLTQAPQT